MRALIVGLNGDVFIGAVHIMRLVAILVRHLLVATLVFERAALREAIRFDDLRDASCLFALLDLPTATPDEILLAATLEVLLLEAVLARLVLGANAFVFAFPVV